MKWRTVKLVVVLAVALIAAGILGWKWSRSAGREGSWRTAAVVRDDLQVSINATGTVEPEEVIDVGAQVAGRIVAFGADARGGGVDYGSPVEEGTVLARIDDSLYAAEAAQAEAQLAAARANLERVRADLKQFEAKARLAERDWQRASRLGPSEALSQANYDAFQSAVESARANLAVGKATVSQAEATVKQNDAALRRARRNLGYCTITSPVRGVIIDRRVNIGQTVVASLNAPSLFLIAKDLKRIQVWVAVNEADIGRIRSGLPVRFTVDAFPGEIFRGEVGKIRLNAAMTQNVVTYTVEIITDNSSGRLLPYLTANVEFELERRPGVLLVPNAALRWSPPEERAGGGQGREGGARKGVGAGPADKKPGSGTVWVLEGKKLRPLPVQVGPSDGMRTEVRGDGLGEGMLVVTGREAAPAEKQQATGNPFTPQLGGKSARPGNSR
ncbi:MAG: efflux RND transporter periplasmic adaptor subunit [Thermodesulfobacteriota bacterium]